MRSRYFILPRTRDGAGESWVWMRIGPGGLVAMRTGFWKSGWDRPEQSVAGQRMLEPSEGFGL